MKTLAVVITVSLFGSAALAGTAATVVLKDGTTQEGEVMDRLPTGYLFKPAGGESRVIPYEAVKEIRMADDGAPSTGNDDRPSVLHLGAALGVGMLGVGLDAPGEFYGGTHHASTMLLGPQLVVALEYPLSSVVALGFRASLGTTPGATFGPSLTFWLGRYLYLGPDLTLTYVVLDGAGGKVDSYPTSGTELTLNGLAVLAGLRVGVRLPLTTRFGITVDARYARSLKSLTTSSDADVFYYMDRGSEHLKPDSWSAWTGLLAVNAHWKF
jgi:hypothetical protein